MTATDTTAKRLTTHLCTDCERCTWNPGPDCGKTDHPHCTVCGHCQYRHEDQDNQPERFVSAHPVSGTATDG